MMKRRISGWWVLPILIVIAAVCYGPVKRSLLEDKGVLELTQAPIWADLQVIEFNHRSEVGLKMPMLLKGVVGPSKYDVLGMEGRAPERPYVWIVLEENAGVNGLFVMPNNVDFVLSCRDLKDIESKETIDGEVAKALEAHCTR